MLSIAQQDQQNNSRHAQAKEARDLIKANDKIKAVLQMRKLEQYQKISQYIRQKVQDSKVKRTLYMRNKFLDHSNEHQKSDYTSLSIDTCANLKNLFKSNHPQQNISKKNAEHIDKLLQFYDLFQKGHMQQQYDKLLQDFIQEYQNEITSENKDIFLKKASKIIKKQLFQKFLSENQNNSTEDTNNKSPVQNSNKQQSIVYQNKLPTSRLAHIHDRIQKNQPSKMMLMNSHTIKVQLPQIPYYFKEPSKFSQRRFSSIQKVCITQLENLNLASKVKSKSRKIKQLSFLNKIRQKKGASLRNKNQQLFQQQSQHF